MPVPPRNHADPYRVTGVQSHLNGQERCRRTLRRRGIDPESTESLLNALLTRSNPEHLLLAFEMLGRRKLPASLLPRLTHLCLTHSGDVAGQALFRIVKMLPRRRAVAALRYFATDRACRIKWAVMSHLCDLGYRDDVPLVASYVRDSLRRRYSSADSGMGIAHSDYCGFLDEFPTMPEVTKLYEWIARFWSQLEPRERDSFTRRQPWFGHHSGRKWVLLVVSRGIAGLRMPNVLYQQVPGFGVSVLRLWSPRFAAAFRTHAAECDVIVPIGDLALRASRRGQTPMMPPIRPIPLPEYQRRLHRTIGRPKDLHEREWRELAEREDAQHVATFRSILDSVPVRHPRQRPAALGPP